ncbi:S8 family serine peptidase [Opitutaceae bacterium]|nr:S8 family serine peptidase [bacterium]MDB4384873.1 S8 family serine peptidase [Opitutaceae bacterium]
MLNSPNRPLAARWLLSAILSTGSWSLVAADTPSVDIEALRSALIPKREVGANTFIAENPTYDGRGVIVAVFDTGVDPAAAGMAVTTTGERKVLDMIDASGSGDVDTSTVVEIDEAGMLAGLTGLALKMPDGITNPSGEFHVGMKPASELFPGAALRRLKNHVQSEWESELSLLRRSADRDEDKALKAAEAKAAADRSREEQNLIALHEAKIALEDNYANSGPGLVYDCVVWHDGTDWRVIVDANRNGDLSDDLELRPYGIAGEFGTFDEHTNATYAVQVYEEGALLSIVTMSGAHGTHVASITASNFPDDPARNGVAPGAQILSIKIGDIRVGGGSYGPSERRAIATAARYGVDIMNASWGGSSTYQDGRDHNAMNYQLLADRFDILAVMSAGNEGPALSTAGSAGGESSRVLGVGAYASVEMGKALYNTIKDSPDAALQFTSRGPTKDGDIGVDIMAPGAAWASTSAETLGSAGMYNGTSMSAPSTSGVVALVLSAAKQNGMSPRPALMRKAMMLGATPITAEAEFTRGAGMANAGGAWAKLQELGDEPAFDVFYDVGVNGGTFVDRGRGLYLRESLDELRRNVIADIAPHWPESSSSDDRFKFDEDFVLKPLDSWIEAPEFMHMANGSERMNLHLNVPERSEKARTNGEVIMSRVDAFVAGKEELGAAFTVPLTIVRPADADVFEEHQLKTSIELSPAVTARRFYEVPDHAEKLLIKIKHTADDPITRRFFLQVVTLAAEQGQHHYKSEHVAWIEEGDEHTMSVKVRGGGVTELAFNQYFYSPEATQLDLELEWQGVGLKPNTLVMEPNQAFLPIELAPLADTKVKVEANLGSAVHVSLPVTTEDYYDDERSERPGSPLNPGPQQDRLVRMKYEVDFEEATTATLGGQQSYDFSEGFTGGRLKVIHESGKVLFNGFPDPKKAFEFPKGKTTVVGEQGTYLTNILDDVKTLPLRINVPIKPAPSLSVLANQRARFMGGPSSDFDFAGGRQHILFLKDTIIEKAAELKPAPDFLKGELSFKDEDDREITKSSLVYMVGDAPSKVTDQDPKAKPGDDLKSETEALMDAVYDLQLEFVRKHRLDDELAVASRRLELLDQLTVAKPENPAPQIERAIEGAVLAGLVSDVWGKLPEEEETETADTDSEETSTDEDAPEPEPETEKLEKAIPAETQILAWLDEAEALADADGVSRFFGAKPVALPGDLDARDEIAAEEKQWAVKREFLATINRLKVDMHQTAGMMDEAWASLAELQRWETEAAEDTTKLVSKIYDAAGYAGLALESLNGRISEDPFNAELLNERITLYRELGWESFAIADERLLAVRAANLARINSL